MRNLNELNDFRIRTQFVLEQFGSYGGPTAGAFLIPYPLAGKRLKCLASADLGWDHVSVSLDGDRGDRTCDRTPTWAEMEFAKRTFFHPPEIVIQLHVAEDDHISIHPYVLHLWRPHGVKIPLPPKGFV